MSQKCIFKVIFIKKKINKKIKKFVMRYFDEIFIKTNSIKKLSQNFTKGYKKKLVLN